ncbi:MAG: hypothetical protein IKA23_03095 [Akkermansia sp.]|nr:hypothetical protein [Akkermansia sp.]MBR2314965.1 hypothetical protein [Akkermansia sp.]
MKSAFLFFLAACSLLTSCNQLSLGPYRNYQVTDDEAIPASKVGGAPYRQQRQRRN